MVVGSAEVMTMGNLDLQALPGPTSWCAGCCGRSARPATTTVDLHPLGSVPDGFRTSGDNGTAALGSPHRGVPSVCGYLGSIGARGGADPYHAVNSQSLRVDNICWAL